MNCKLYISDEGFGPLVRQSAILEEMATINDQLRFTLQTQKHLSAAKRIINSISYIDRYNNITWKKNALGSPDIPGIRKHFEHYNKVSDEYIKLELEDFQYDFLISDFVYEAFEVARVKKVPAFGVAHFTWDWFFCKLYPPPVSSATINRFLKYAEQAKVLYFPPFTPKEITGHFKHKVKEVPLIVRKHVSEFKWETSDKFRVLIMDSGSGLLKKHIENALDCISKVTDVEFYVSSSFTIQSDNIKKINKNQLFLDYIPHMDLVIGRAGFNTISECIAFRVPMLLISEAMNPEMNENIVNIKHEGLGSFISLRQFSDGLDKFLPKFIQHEYPMIAEAMKYHDLRTDGARVIAEDILDQL